MQNVAFIHNECIHNEDLWDVSGVGGGKNVQILLEIHLAESYSVVEQHVITGIFLLTI